MGNQDNSIQREDNISNDSQLSEGSNNQQHNKKPKWLNKKKYNNHFNIVGCYNSGNIFIYSFI